MQALNIETCLFKQKCIFKLLEFFSSTALPVIRASKRIPRFLGASTLLSVFPRSSVTTVLPASSGLFPYSRIPKRLALFAREEDDAGRRPKNTTSLARTAGRAGAIFAFD
jgi:hypothetical protein